MTVREFLSTTKLSASEVADRCGVHLSQVGRWKSGASFPNGRALLELIELSGNTIDKPARKRRHKAA